MLKKTCVHCFNVSLNILSCNSVSATIKIHRLGKKYESFLNRNISVYKGLKSFIFTIFLFNNHLKKTETRSNQII